MKCNRFGSFVVLSTAVTAVTNPSVNVNAVDIKDFFKYFSLSNLKNFFNCIFSFIGEKVSELVNGSTDRPKTPQSTGEKISKFYSDFINTPNASLKKAKKDLLPVNFIKLIQEIAKDCEDDKIIHIWDKNGDLGLPSFDGDREEKINLNGLTLISVERKVLQRQRDRGYYHGWVVESQIDPGKILFIHPKGDLKDLGSGEKRFYVSERWGPVPRFEGMTEEEKERQRSFENSKIAESEHNTPNLDLDLLKNHAPELYKFLENKGTECEAAPFLESGKGSEG